MRYMTQDHANAVWLKLCPPLYADTSLDKLPSKARSISHIVLDWQYGAKGLFLSGESRSGKTRLTWLLLKRLILKEHIPCMAFDGIGWGLAVSRAFGDPATTEAWLNKICSCPLLFLDDLFKFKITEAQEVALIGLLERRPAWRLPTIITTNTTGKSLLKRMSDSGIADRAEPILERIREFLEIINISEDNTNEK